MKVKNPLRDIPVDQLDPKLQVMSEDGRRHTLNQLISAMHQELHFPLEEGATEKHAAMAATMAVAGPVLMAQCKKVAATWGDEEEHILQTFMETVMMKQMLKALGRI
jgi:hypothetical protein